MKKLDEISADLNEAPKGACALILKQNIPIEGLRERAAMAISIEAGPQEQVIRLDVSWKAYRALASDLGESSHARLAYDGKTLELMSPRNDHESYTRFIDALLTHLMSEWDINIASSGSATLEAEPVAVEPDNSYYIQNASKVDGVQKIDLRTDPPPDLVVEVDMSHQRLDKSALYATIGVPEFWRYNRDGLQAFELVGTAYVAIEKSSVIAGLPIAILAAVLERRLDFANRAKILKEWQHWLRGNRHLHQQSDPRDRSDAHGVPGS